MASSAQSLNHHVRPDKLMSGPVRLSLNVAAVYKSGGKFYAGVGSTRTAFVRINGLAAPATIRCDVNKSATAYTVEIVEFLGNDATGNTHTVELKDEEQFEFVAIPDPAGDYSYELTFEKSQTAWQSRKLFGCHVKTV